MKRIFFSLLILLVLNMAVRSQTVAEQLADKIARKLKDTLSLNEQQKEQLYTINVQLSEQKATIRQQYPVSDSLRIKIQRIENTRDSLYRPVLGEEKFMLYRQKKRNLVNNN